MPVRGIRPLALLGLLVLAASATAQERRIDETALRYYAAQGQTARVEAEAQRLTSLHPGWRLPDDIWTARPSPADEKPLWALFAADDLDGLDAALAARRKAEPNWQPSDDLARKLRHKQLRKALLAKAGSGQWLSVSELAGRFGKGDEVDDVELTWTVAEAFARSDRQAEAFALYSAILTRRDDPRERIATVQKALGLLPIAEVEKLYAMGRKDASSAPEFGTLDLDMTRGRIAAVLHDEPEARLDPAELARFETQARQTTAPNDPGLIAWLALKQDRNADALSWFKLAIERGGDATIAHGLAHSLLRLGKRREAEEVAYAWREPLANNAILFIDVLESDLTRPVPPPIEPERLARYARVVLDNRSGEGAQGLGWYAYNSCQFETALDWFRRASAWMPKEGTIYGQALALQRLKRGKEFSELLNRYDGLFPTVVALALPAERSELPGPCDKATATSNAREDALASLRRANLPSAVSPENPLRFPVQQQRGEALREASTEARPLVARRVSGVTAMPYEKLGFTLLPGWLGQTAPSDIPASEQPPARGTLWAETRQDGQAGTPLALSPGSGDGAANRFRR